MQVAQFNLGVDDPTGIEAMNRFLRGHRVMTLDKAFHEGAWSVLVTYQPGQVESERSRRAPKIDYREVLDEVTFARFSRLRDVRKDAAQSEKLPAYAVFTNEQLAAMAKARCATRADLAKIDGVGESRIEKYGTAVLEALKGDEKLSSETGTDR